MYRNVPYGCQNILSTLVKMNLSKVLQLLNILYCIKKAPEVVEPQPKVKEPTPKPPPVPETKPEPKLKPKPEPTPEKKLEPKPELKKPEPPPAKGSFCHSS